MFRLRSELLSFAAQFTGDYAPFQGIELRPLAGGVVVTASNRGAVAMIGYDPTGVATESAVILPDSELIKTCQAIKTAEREVTIEGDTALVTTYYKEHSKAVEVPIRRSQVPFPDIAGVCGAVLSNWSERPDISGTAGRYDTALLKKAIMASIDYAPSLVLSSFDGGPLRIQREDLEVVVFLMPQEAQPIPPCPPWLADYAAGVADEQPLAA